MKSAKYIGLDIGSSGAKVIVLAVNGKDAQLEACHVFDTLNEGILNESELYGSISEWLKKNGLGNLPTTVAVPQYLVTCTEKDFPKCPPEKIPDMVAFETTQISGLSDEAMSYGYVILPPGLDRKNPVLIGMGREQLIRERVALYGGNNIRCDDLGIGGIAVVNAFYAIHPEKLEMAEPVLLLDIGRENTTAIVISGGQVLFVASLMFGGEKFEQALTERGSLGPKSMQDVVLTDEIGHSQILAAAKYLEDEIHGALETWRSQESVAISQMIVKKAYICGGISRMKGLAAWLQERLETPVEVIGPKVNDEIHPEQMLSYGLALQAAGIAQLPLSLMPEDVRQLNLRMRLWPFLAAAVAIVALALAFVEIRWFVAKSNVETALQRELESLESSSSMIEEIKRMRANVYSNEARLVPYVVAGNQIGNMLTVLNTLGECLNENCLLVYLGDEDSYFGQKAAQGKNDQKNNAKGKNLFGDNNAKVDGKKEENPEFNIRLTPKDVVPATKFVACGFYHVGSDPYQHLNELSDELRNKGIFENIDVMSDRNRNVRNDVFSPWESFLQSKKYSGFRPYAFKLPLKDKGIDSEVVSEYIEEQVRLKTKGRKKK